MPAENDKKKSYSVPKEIGRTGLRHTTQNLIDDELAVNLKWPNSINTFKQMRSDSLIAGSLFFIEQYIRKVDWEVEPYGKLEAKPKDKKRADIIRDNLFKTMERSWDQVITDILSFIQYGFSFHEPLYRYENGLFLWRDFAIRSQDSITGLKFDKQGKGKLEFIEQTRVSCMTFGTSYEKSTVDIPVDRLLHFRTSSHKNSPIGRSILKNSFKAWYFKTKLEEIEATGAERELNGLPKIEIPSEFFAADPVEDPERYATLQHFINIGTNARNNEQACIILPSDVDETGNKLFTFDLISSKGTRAIDISKTIERYDARLAQSMMTDFMLMGAGSTGSFALSDNKIGSFIASLEAFLGVIAEQFNRRAIPKLYEMNGWDKKEACQLTFKPIGQSTLGELGDFLDKCGNFMSPDKTLENALRAKADLPARDENDLYLQTPVNVHQAESQRIGMTQSAEPTQDTPSDEREIDAEGIMKSLMNGQYDG